MLHLELDITATAPGELVDVISVKEGVDNVPDSGARVFEHSGNPMHGFSFLSDHLHNPLSHLVLDFIVSSTSDGWHGGAKGARLSLWEGR